MLIGGAGNDILNGDENDDVLIGGAGADVLACDPGNDVAISDGSDVVGADCEAIRGPARRSGPNHSSLGAGLM